MVSLLSVWRLLSVLLLVASTSAATPSISVSTDTDLQSALVDESIREIVVEQDIVFERDNWINWYSHTQPYVRNSNLTIRGFPPLRKLDFAFTGDGRYQLNANVFLNISDIILDHARYGAGVQLDFLASSPGSYVVLWNSIMMRMACISSTKEPDAVAAQPRIPGFPGQQLATFQNNFCVRRSCYDNVLVYVDYTRLTGTNTEDTAAGGYAMVMHNFTKVCRKFIDPCDSSETNDDCVRAELDRASDVLTPGQIAMEAQEIADRHQRNIIIGAVVGGVVGLIMLLAAAALLARRALRRAATRHWDQKLLSSTQGTVTTTNTPETDLELGLEGSAQRSNSPRPQKGVALNGTPPGDTQNSWELTACKTAERFLHGQSQQGRHSTEQHWVQGNAAAGNWYQGAPGSNGTNTIHASHDTTASAEVTLGSPATSDKVKLGVLLGAGSFGRVYKGRWRGLEVAVKVLQHSRAAAASVANEVDLMMSFQHPNIVSALHFVSWRKRKPPKVDPFETLDKVEPRGDRAWHSVDSNFVDTAGPTGEYPEDTQTWIVQEFCNGGNLSEHLLSRADVSEAQLPDGHNMLRLLFRLREVAEGMAYLHRQAVVHGDLKSGNVLLHTSVTSPYGRLAKITDFGLSRAMATGETHRSTHTLGTVSHMAPELLRYGKMAPTCDVYSFGVMMWELLTSRTAFSGLHYGAIIERVALMGERPSVPSGAPEDYALLMCSCWSADPEQRPTFDQVVRCMDIMITSRQQELAEAKSGSTHDHSSSNNSGAQHVQPHLSHPNSQPTHQQAVSCSSGEFDMSRGGYSSGKYASGSRVSGDNSGQVLTPSAQNSGAAPGARMDRKASGPYGPEDL